MSVTAGKVKAHNVTCHNCEIRAGKYGRNRNGSQRYRCRQCGRTYTEDWGYPLFDEMRIPEEKAIVALRMLTEGCSVRSTARLTGLEKKTVLKLLLLAGERCRRFLDKHVRNVNCSLVQADEIWTYCLKKQRRIIPGDPDEAGDQYCFVALAGESRLVICHRVGKRDGRTALRFAKDLAGRLANRVQLSTDFAAFYPDSVELAFGSEVDYGVLVKLYQAGGDAGREHYVPSRCVGSQRIVMQGEPDKALICTSHVERNNLNIRTAMKRFTRLGICFSKSLKHLKAAVNLHFAWYNFAWVHSTIQCTPAMEARIADHIWDMEEILRNA